MVWYGVVGCVVLFVWLGVVSCFVVICGVSLYGGGLWCVAAGRVVVHFGVGVLCVVRCRMCPWFSAV